MKYINSKVLTNLSEINNKYYAWLILGYPISCENEPGKKPIPDGANDINGAPVFDNSKMNIKDFSIAGISIIGNGKITTSEAAESGSITYTFPGSGTPTTIFCMTGNDDAPSKGFRVDHLALVSYKQSIQQKIYQNDSYSTDKIKEIFFYFNNDKISDNNYKFIYKGPNKDENSNHYRIMDTNSGAIEDVLIVYGVNSSADFVNFLNYTGFTVGQSVLTINGLYTNN